MCLREHFIKSDMKCTHSQSHAQCASNCLYCFNFKKNSLAYFISEYVFLSLVSVYFVFVQSIVWSLRCCVKQNDSLEGFFWFEKMKYRNDEWNTNFNAFLCCCLSKCSNSACTHMRALFQCTLYAVNIRHKSVGKSISAIEQTTTTTI